MSNRTPLADRRENSTPHATTAPFEALLGKVGDLLAGAKFAPCADFWRLSAGAGREPEQTT